MCVGYNGVIPWTPNRNWACFTSTCNDQGCSYTGQHWLAGFFSKFLMGGTSKFLVPIRTKLDEGGNWKYDYLIKLGYFEVACRRQKSQFTAVWCSEVLATGPRVFSWGGDWGSPIRQKFCQSPPPSNTCPRFWTKAYPPSRGLSTKIWKMEIHFCVKFDYF